MFSFDRIEITTTIRTTIKDRRLNVGISQLELARLVGVSGATLSFIENGLQKTVSPEVYGLLQKTLDAMENKTKALVTTRRPRMRPTPQHAQQQAQLRRELRDERHTTTLSQHAAASHLGMTRKAFQRWESGEGLRDLPEGTLLKYRELLAASKKKTGKPLWECIENIQAYLETTSEAQIDPEQLLAKHGCQVSDRNEQVMSQLLTTLGWRKKSPIWIKAVRATPRKTSQVVLDSTLVWDILVEGGMWSIPEVALKTGLTESQVRETMKVMETSGQVMRVGSTKQTRYLALEA